MLTSSEASAELARRGSDSKIGRTKPNFLCVCVACAARCVRAAVAEVQGPDQENREGLHLAGASESAGSLPALTGTPGRFPRCVSDAIPHIHSELLLFIVRDAVLRSFLSFGPCGFFGDPQNQRRLKVSFIGRKI